MAWQKGPGEGFMAAKEDALILNPLLRCRRIDYVQKGTGRREQVGFIVEDENGKTIGRGKLSRDAWGDAFLKLGGKYVKGQAVHPKLRSRP